MKKPLIGLLALMSFSAFAGTNSIDAQEMLAEGAMSMEEMRLIDADQAAKSFSINSVNSMVSSAGRIAEMDAPTADQLKNLVIDNNKGEMCGRKVNLFTLTEDQILAALQAEQLRMMNAGINNPEPRFISVNKSPREYYAYNAATNKYDVLKRNTEGQTMTIYTLLAGNLEKVLEVNVSTGKEETVKATNKSYCATTPAGFFRPYKMYRSYVSGTWEGSQMPNAVFIFNGIALHATPNDAAHQGSLGKRASGGCIRLQGPDFARAQGRPNDSEVDISLKVRLETMLSGRGIEQGEFSTVNEGAGRVRITNNTVKTHSAERIQGLVGAKADVDSWGTIVYIHY
jgi:lipoprotein-anchoring transpeptidase ErfK/SrfK